MIFFFNVYEFRKEHLMFLLDKIGVGANSHQKLIGHDMPGLEWVLPKEKSFCFSRREREKYSVK